MRLASSLNGGVEVQWSVTYAEIAGEEFMSLLQELRQQDEPERIRLVFWFS